MDGWTGCSPCLWQGVSGPRGSCRRCCRTGSSAHAFEPNRAAVLAAEVRSRRSKLMPKPALGCAVIGQKEPTVRLPCNNSRRGTWRRGVADPDWSGRPLDTSSRALPWWSDDEGLDQHLGLVSSNCHELEQASMFAAGLDDQELVCSRGDVAAHLARRRSFFVLLLPPRRPWICPGRGHDHVPPVPLPPRKWTAGCFHLGVP
jgi:hypothetical protein